MSPAVRVVCDPLVRPAAAARKSLSASTASSATPPSTTGRMKISYTCQVAQRGGRGGRAPSEV
eukprot:2045963-Pyramimonas_sp.AAC.1